MIFKFHRVSTLTPSLTKASDPDFFLASLTVCFLFQCNSEEYYLEKKKKNSKKAFWPLQIKLLITSFQKFNATEYQSIV